MDQLLAAHYGTGAVEQNEDLEKQAQVELFAKLAAENGIDLSTLNEDQVNYLWNETFSKTAEPDKKEEEEEEKKKEEAKKEHEEKKEAMAKIAEADFLGRVMAHSMTDELNKIAGKGDPTFMAHLRSLGTKVKNIATGAQAREAHEELQKLKPLIEKARPGQEAHLQSLAKEVKSRRLAGAGKTGLLYGGGAGGLAAGGAGLHHALGAKHEGKEVHASALDNLAAEQAVVKAAEVGWDPEEAANRVTAILTLGAPESEKIASVSDLDTAVGIRAVELLELAGYPVNWGE
jgi:hypothetical protein